MQMWFQRETASTLFTALVTNYDLLLYRALYCSNDPSFSGLVCHNVPSATAAFRLVVCTKLHS
jgi:hypothetical protein